jgi:phage FluMu protein Com
MPDIFFKCEACGKYLLVDDVAAGLSIKCPDCDASITIPKWLVVQQCPNCNRVLTASAAMKGELVRCPSCQGEVQIPGQLPHEADGKPSVAHVFHKISAGEVTFVCPKCHAQIRAAEGTSNKSVVCPYCKEEVHFRHKLHLMGDDEAPHRSP